MVKKYWFLRIGSDYLEDAKRYSTKATAIYKFKQIAEELARYGQEIEASLHAAPSREAVDEYPDFVLVLGPRGGVQVQNT